jgi:magnesium transporter
MKLGNIFRRDYAAPGAAPGVLAEQHTQPPPNLRVIAFNANELEEFDAASPTTIKERMTADRRYWIDVQGDPGASTLEEFGRVFGLHALALADTVNHGQRPKVEDYEDHLFCVVRMGGEGESTRFDWEQVSVFISRQFVITIQERPGDCFDPVRARLRAGRKMIRGGGGDYLGAMLIDAVVDGYFPLLEAFGERLEDLETRVLAQPTREVLSDIYREKRELLMFRRSVWPLRDALNQLLRDGHPIFKKGTLPYLRDTVDHLLQVVDVVESCREIAGSFIDVYLSSVSHRTNEVMRVLTIFSTIFIPLTFVAGIYGMNFEHIPELKWKDGYFYFWGLSGLVFAGMLVMFHRMGWLRKSDPLQ